MENEDTEISALVKSQANYYAAPPELHRSIGAALALSGHSAHLANLNLPVREKQRWWSIGAAFATGMVLAVAGMLAFGFLQQQNRMTEQVVENHVRSLMVSHLADVASSDQHTVKPWFDGKLDFSPPVQDLAAQGYPLVGGRLDYLNGQQVAALVYRHRAHAINLFVWPVRDQFAFVSVSSSRQGFNVVSWREGGMEFWAVSDVQSVDLRQFTQLLQTKEQRQ